MASDVVVGVTGQRALPDLALHELEYDVERTSVRVVLLDANDCVLLFDTVDPTAAALGSWWELPGGGMERGETVAQTAVREIREETGLEITAESVAEPNWRRTATYFRRGRRTLQHEHVVLVRLTSASPKVIAGGRTSEELQDYRGERWWPIADLRASSERFFPGTLPALVDQFLRGEPIDEPFEYWN